MGKNNKKTTAKQPEGEKKPKVDSISFPNKHIEDILEWLNVPMHSEKARARNRISDILEEKYKTYESERLNLVKKYAMKKGEDFVMEDVVNPITGASMKHYTFTDENKKKFQDAFDNLKEEAVIFDILPSNREYWRMVRKIFMDINKEMDIGMTKFWELVIDTLENI